MYCGFDYTMDENSNFKTVKNETSKILTEPVSFKCFFEKKKKENLLEKTLVFHTFKISK